TQSQGRISVQSQPGRGTTFSIVLPVATPKVPTTHPENDVVQASGAGRTVLLVEDEDMVRDVMQQAFSSAGYRVMQASDGKSALTLAAEQPIDLLCTDGILPGMPVKQLIDDFRQLFPTAKVVVCSGHVEEELLRRRIAQGDCAFISKPFTPDELLRKIAELDNA